MTIHPTWATQINALKQDEASTRLRSKYANYADVFPLGLAMELPENISINGHAIELEEGKQLLYKPTYSLEPIELETLKTYIKTYLQIGFIQPSKSLAVAPILFDKSQTIPFGCLSIIKVFITSQWKIDTRYPSLVRP